MSDLSLREHFPIVFVHGYEVYEGGRLGPLAKAVCEAVKRLLAINDDVRAILLGGWHLKEAGRYTIANAMTKHLSNDDISPQRIITKW